MNIGQLARLTGAPIDTIRYYERQQLLPTPQRSASGYRRYGDDDVTRLNFIRRAKALGFSLEEIAELMAISAGRHGDMAAMDMAAVKQAASAKLAQVEERQAELARMHAALLSLVDACPGHGALDECPIIAALGKESA